MEKMNSTRCVMLVAALAFVLQPLRADSIKPEFGWFAQFVSFDAATRTLTAKAPIESHVANYAGKFSPGDRIVLVWTQFGGEADAIRYVAAEKAMAAEGGYIVRGSFVSYDATGRTLTFKTAVSESAARVLSMAKLGTPVRIGMPTLPPAAGATPATVALNKTAPPRPAPPVKVAEKARDVAGTWVVDTNIPNPRDVTTSAIKLECVFTQDAKDIGGSCKGPAALGELPVKGGINGDTVTFIIEVPFGNYNAPMPHTGKLNAEGTAFEGKISAMGAELPFKAAKR